MTDQTTPAASGPPQPANVPLRGTEHGAALGPSFYETVGGRATFEKLRAEQAKFHAELRNRVQGAFAGGAIKDKVDRALQAEEVARQSSASLFAAGTGPLKRAERQAGERLTLGRSAEAQLASLLNPTPGGSEGPPARVASAMW